MSVKFTVIIPVHNGMPYIQDCIKSALTQSYKDYNIIVLENCSNDGTAEYLDNLKSEKIETIKSDKLLSIEENWARIKYLEMNEYMTILMADDFLAENYLSSISEMIKKYPNCNIYRSNINLINERSEIFHKSKIKEKITIYDYLRGRLAHTYTETFAGYCIKTEKYKDIGGIVCRFRLMSTDEKLVMELIGENNYMAVASEHLVNYRCHTGSESGSPNIEATIAGYKYWFNWIYNLNNKKLRQIVKKYLPYHFKQINRFFLPDEMKKLKEIYFLYGINENNFYYQYVYSTFKLKSFFKNKIRKIYHILKYFLSLIKFPLKFFKRLFVKIPAVAVLRVDGIGDYILMHDFLYYVKNCKKYKNKKLVFIGRIEFSELSKQYDKNVVDDFIWLDWFKWNNFYYRMFFWIKMKFYKYGFDTVISPNHLKDTYITERLLNLIKAKEIIGCKGPNYRITKEYKNLYTRLIDTGENFIFEFDRNKIFFEKLLDTKININRPTLCLPIDMNKKYFYISPFAGDIKRKWREENFAKIINFLISNYKYDCVILGSNLDLDSAEKLISFVDKDKTAKVINAVNKISIAMLPLIFSVTSKLLIANDTGTVHIAVAENTPFLVISNGLSYGKFQPYKGFEQEYVYPNEFDMMLKNNKKISPFYYNSYLDINLISVEKVIEKIKQILDKR